MKKLVALFLTLAMVLSLCAMAFAADGDPAPSTEDAGSVTELGTDAAGETAAHVVALKKSLRLVDTTTGIALYAPSITYTYTLNTTALTEDELDYDTKVGDAGDLNLDYQSDEKSISGAGIKVKDGATTSGAPTVTIADDGTISFDSSDVLVATDNVISRTDESDDDNQNVIVKSLGISTEAGTLAGIFRYKITETSDPENKADVGVTESEDYTNIRYLDVYVTYEKVDDEDVLAVTNVVLFRKGGSSVNYQTKTEGWTSANDLDIYETADVTVTKYITGKLADKTHEFPFSFTVSNPGTGSKYSWNDDDESVAENTGVDFVGTSGTTVINSGYESNVLGLEDGSSFVIYGLPVNSTTKCIVQVSEKNDTGETYTYTTSGFENDKTEDTQFDSEKLTSAVMSKADIADDVDDLEFTNKMEDISITGVSFRFAPYLMILAAGFALVLISRKRKAEEV